MVIVPASRPSPEAGTPVTSRAARNKPSRVLHEPFVSPEFGASRATAPSRRGGGPDSSDRGEIFPTQFRGDGGTTDRRSWQGQQALLPQAAPLYTVLELYSCNISAREGEFGAKPCCALQRRPARIRARRQQGGDTTGRLPAEVVKRGGIRTRHRCGRAGRQEL